LIENLGDKAGPLDVDTKVGKSDCPLIAKCPLRASVIDGPPLEYAGSRMMRPSGPVIDMESGEGSAGDEISTRWSGDVVVET